MGSTEKDVEKKANASTVPQEGGVSVGSFRRRLSTRGVTLLIAILVVVGAVTWVVLHDHNANSADTASQKLWETVLQSSLSDENKQQDVVKATDALLAGGQTGKFTISSKDRAQLYLDRASAYSSLNEYKNAVSDYARVVAAGGATKQAALQGEVEAGYKVGQRKQLIPLYEQLIALKNKSGDPMRGSVTAQYEQNIQTLRQGGELTF